MRVDSHIVLLAILMSIGSSVLLAPLDIEATGTTGYECGSSVGTDISDTSGSNFGSDTAEKYGPIIYNGDDDTYWIYIYAVIDSKYIKTYEMQMMSGITWLGTTAPNIPTYNGFKILGWADEENATSVKYNQGQSITIIAPDDVDESYTKYFYAVTTPLLTLTYDGNDPSATDVPSADTGSTSATTSAEYTTTVTSDSPVLTGHTFFGWSSSASGAVEYKGGETITITSDTTLYAIWQEPSVKLTFYPQNGEDATTITIENGSKPQVPADPELYGYAFGGWYISTDYAIGIDLNAPVTSDTSYYAKWTGILAFTTEPVANGTYASMSPNTYCFSAAGSENVMSITWDFGDGATATGMYVSHWYRDDSAYTVTLTIYGWNGEVDTQTFAVGSEEEQTAHEGGGGSAMPDRSSHPWDGFNCCTGQKVHLNRSLNEGFGKPLINSHGAIL